MTADITRIPVPSLPKAQVRRKTPAPFTRPSISIGAGLPPGERREWHIVKVIDIKVGDIVPGIGRVFEATEKFSAEDREWTVTLRGGVDNTRVFHGNETVWAYTATKAVRGDSD